MARHAPASPIFPYPTLFRSAMRGHVVYLADEARLIGGTPRLLAADPNRRILRDQSAYYEALFKDLDVTLSLGTRVEAEGHRSEEHTSELQSHVNVVCRLLLE